MGRDCYQNAFLAQAKAGANKFFNAIGSHFGGMGSGGSGGGMGGGAMGGGSMSGGYGKF